MGDFLNALQGELAGAPPVLLCALAVGLLISIACGVVGTYVVTRRITYLAGGIAPLRLGRYGRRGLLPQSPGLVAYRSDLGHPVDHRPVRSRRGGFAGGWE